METQKQSNDETNNNQLQTLPEVKKFKTKFSGKAINWDYIGKDVEANHNSGVMSYYRTIIQSSSIFGQIFEFILLIENYFINKNQFNSNSSYILIKYSYLTHSIITILINCFIFSCISNCPWIS